MKRIWLAVVLAVGAAGCATLSGPNRIWWKPGVTRSEMQADLREAAAAAEGSGRTDLDRPQSAFGDTPRMMLTEKEMRARGYTAQPVHQAPFAGE